MRIAKTVPERISVDPGTRWAEYTGLTPDHWHVYTRDDQHRVVLLAQGLVLADALLLVYRDSIEELLRRAQVAEHTPAPLGSVYRCHQDCLACRGALLARSLDAGSYPKPK